MDNNDEKKQKTLKTCQTLITVAFIAGPVSLLIGGVALSTAALVCAIIAFVKMKGIIRPEDAPGTIERSLYNQSIVALGISGVAMALNLVTFVYAFGMLLTAAQSGDLSSLMSPFGSAPQSTPDVPGKSIWD